MEKNLSRNKSVDLEALRGFASLFVVWHHIEIYGRLLDPNYELSAGVFYSPSGHFCVLIFFVLSGYVIGISNKKSLTWSTSVLYLKKRLVRIYPIYIITLVFTMAVTIEYFNVFTIASNIFMLQVLSAKAINPLSWSLHYEIRYYLLFIFISIFRMNYIYIILFSFVIGIGNYMLHPILAIPLITSYCYGLIFWVAGLVLSQYLPNVQNQKSSYQILMGCLFFMLCIDQFNLFNTLSRHYIDISFFPYVNWAEQAIEIHDLSYLPFALVILIIFSEKKIPYRLNFMRILVIVSSFPKIVYLFKNLHNNDLIQVYVWPMFFLLLSLICLFIRSSWLENIGKQVVRIGIELGSLSYSIYLIHFPVILLLNRLNIFSGNWQSFVFRVAVMMLLTIVFSYILEKVLQPYLKKLFFKNQSSKDVITNQKSTVL
jgi:peptidoglycan/LPS O-acetylase OafA/YrhL